MRERLGTIPNDNPNFYENDFFKQLIEDLFLFKLFNQIKPYFEDLFLKGYITFTTINPITSTEEYYFTNIMNKNDDDSKIKNFIKNLTGEEKANFLVLVLSYLYYKGCLIKLPNTEKKFVIEDIDKQIILKRYLAESYYFIMQSDWLLPYRRQWQLEAQFHEFVGSYFKSLLDFYFSEYYNQEKKEEILFQISVYIQFFLIKIINLKMFGRMQKFHYNDFPKRNRKAKALILKKKLSFNKICKKKAFRVMRNQIIETANFFQKMFLFYKESTNYTVSDIKITFGKFSLPFIRINKSVKLFSCYFTVKNKTQYPDICFVYQIDLMPFAEYDEFYYNKKGPIMG